jgi:hypothetical protein
MGSQENMKQMERGNIGAFLKVSAEFPSSENQCLILFTVFFRCGCIWKLGNWPLLQWLMQMSSLDMAGMCTNGCLLRLPY